MALEYLQGLDTNAPYSDETVNRVKDLLNAGAVDVNEVSTYFGVPKDVVVQGLTGISKGAFQSGGINDDQVRRVEGLVRTGVMSVPEVSQYFGAAPETVEGFLSNTVGYNENQLNQARMGLPVTASGSTGSGIPTGLRGAEEALTGGATGAIEMLDQLNQAARGDLAGQYGQGIAEARAQAEAAKDYISSGTAEGLAALQEGIAQGRQDITSAFGRAEGMFDPYRQAGTTALDQQLALSGALGQEAFDQAYQESPQMAFLREQGMRANLAGAAATGGLGGGNVQKELQRFGQGLASQGLQQQISNLGALSGQGLDATSNAATVATGRGANLSNLASTEAQARLNALANRGSNLANVATTFGGQQLTAMSNLGNQLANVGLSTGLPAAQTISNLGINLASGRTRAGELLANQYGQAATQLGGIYTQQGRDVASTVDSQRRMIMDLVNQGVLTEAQAQEAFSTNMANLQASTGGQLSGVPNAPIFAPDYSGQIGNAFQAAGTGAYIAKQGQTGSGTGSAFQPQVSGGFNPAAMPSYVPSGTGFTNPVAEFQIPQIGGF